MKTSRATHIAAIMLFVVATYLTIALLLQYLDYNTLVLTQGTVRSFFSILWSPGTLLYSVYGYSSMLIPFFLLASGTILFVDGWNKRKIIYLFGSIFAFFTIVCAEALFKLFVTHESSFFNSIKAITICFITIVLLIIEYALLGILNDNIFPKNRTSFLYSERNISGIKTKTDFHREASEINADDADTAAYEILAKELVSQHFIDDIAEHPIVLKDYDTEAEKNTIITDDDFPVAEDIFFDCPEPSPDEDMPITQDTAQATEDLQEAEVEVVQEEFEKAHAKEPIFLDLNWREKEKKTEQAVPNRLAETLYDSLCSDAEAEFLEAPFADTIIDELDEDDEMESDFITEDEIIDEEDEILKKTIEEIPFYTTPATKHVAQSALESASINEISHNMVHNEAKNGGAVLSATPKRKRGATYAIPSDGLLKSYPDGEYWIIDDATQKASAVLKETLREFKIQAEVTGIRKGPVVTMFEILPAPGVRLSKIVNLQDNISLRLAASSVRIVAPIPGKHAVGIEVPNKQRFIVSFKELIETDAVQFKKMEIPVILGKDITGEAILLDLAATPHLLIAGSTGSGKSVCVNTMILSILYKRSPQEVRLILIDPKIVELKLYNDIPHLLTPVITEPKKAFQALQYCLCEMERRYAMLDRMGVRDIKNYNRRIDERDLAMEKLPYIVVVIDEFADLMATTGKELESTVARLAAMSRAVGIHLVLATQRPSIDVITGLIKANIPTRIAFMVASKMDSRIIIDQMGAEKLLGRGDMLYASAVDPFPVRIQGAFVTEDEVESVVEYVKQYGEPEYIDEEIFFDDDDEGDTEASLFSEGDDPLYEKALEIVLQAGKGSASYIQRRLKIGYNRAARLVEEMEQRGIVGPANGSKPRDILHFPSKG